MNQWLARWTKERSDFEPWPRTFCCILGQNTLLSQCLAPPTCIKIGTGEFVGKHERSAERITGEC